MTAPREDPARPTASAWSLFLRSLLIQGSWNYRTLLGSGLAWVLLPATRGHTRGQDPGIEATFAAEPFNSHPYLSTVAVGALAHEAAAAPDPDRIHRFKTALRSPLGSLGDRLVWGAWRPFCLLAALWAGTAGLPPLWIVAALLLAYNALHVTLRGWGLRIGLAEGIEVAGVLARARLGEHAERIEVGGVILAGFLVGLLAHRALEIPGWTVLSLSAGCAALLAGHVGGTALRRWIPTVLIVLVVIGLVVGSPPPLTE